VTTFLLDVNVLIALLDPAHVPSKPTWAELIQTCTR